MRLIQFFSNIKNRQITNLVILSVFVCKFKQSLGEGDLR